MGENLTHRVEMVLGSEQDRVRSVLLMRSATGELVLPGGEVETGEPGVLALYHLMLRQTSIAMDSPRLLDTREGADAAGNRVVTETFMFVRYWRPNAVAGGGFKELAWFGLDELLADRDGISAELHLTLCLADEAWGGVKA